MEECLWDFATPWWSQSQLFHCATVRTFSLHFSFPSRQCLKPWYAFSLNFGRFDMSQAKPSAAELLNQR
jgi:hypothetical protein